MKVCRKCGIEKPLNLFYKSAERKDGYLSECKQCRSLYMKNTQKQNGKNYYLRNRGTIISRNRRYDIVNREKVRENHRVYMKKRRGEDLEFRLIDNYRSRINAALRGQLKEQTFLDLVGCTVSQFKDHLESQFTKEMTWENYGTYWEIDHIHPLIKGGSFHYENTQPLSCSDNRSKGSNILEI